MKIAPLRDNRLTSCRPPAQHRSISLLAIFCSVVGTVWLLESSSSMPFARPFFRRYQRRYFCQGFPVIARAADSRPRTFTHRHFSSVSLLRGGGALGHNGSRVPPFSGNRSASFTTTTTSLEAASVDSPGFQDFLAQHDSISLSYITDIEGDKAYLDRYVHTSKLLTFSKRTPTSTTSSFRRKNKDDDVDDDNENRLPYIFPYDHCIDFLDSNSMLVFGGDLWDKGGFDLYVTRQLLDLKRRYPHRVFWVLGNRDINKLRMTQELGLPHPDSTKPVKVPYHPGLNWIRGSGRVGDPDGELPPMDPGERLRWILGNTMASPNGMEHRRQELAWETSVDDKCNGPLANEIVISDDEVVRSYQESCHPRGEMGLFLWEALLAARIGPVLFVHGSLPLTPEAMEDAKNESRSLWDDMSFAMPWLPKEERSINQRGVSIEQWMDALNQFCHDKLEQWRMDVASIDKCRDELEEQGIDYYDVQDERSVKKTMWAYRGGYGNGPPYADLMQYGMGLTRDGKKNPTVVYNTFTPEGMPMSFLPADKRDEKVESDVAACTRDFFARTSIQLILTGHKPQGDSPSPIRVDEKAWVVCADTSYSGDTMWWSDGTSHDDDVRGASSNARGNLGRGSSLSFRGDVAVSEVLISLSHRGTTLDSVKYHGVLSDGTEYESLNLLEAASLQTSLGQVAPDDMVPDALESPHQGRWWTKNIFSDGSQLFHAGKGFNVWNYVVIEEEKVEAASSAGE